MEKFESAQLQPYLDYIDLLTKGQFPPDLPDEAGEMAPLAESLSRLSQQICARAALEDHLAKIILRINSGLLLEDILETIYEDFTSLLPYDRIGYSLIDAGTGMVRAVWARSSQQELCIDKGYESELEGSSLQAILETRQPRILNDLEEYLQRKPDSKSTRLIMQEGMRSSLTCPLVANGQPVGFIFFSDTRKGAYTKEHVEIFQRLAGDLSVMVEKGRMASELAEQKARVEEQNIELGKLNEQKNVFLGIAAHDLRSPLGNILLSIQLLLNKDNAWSTTEERGVLFETLLQNISRQADHMLNLLNELLDVTMIESGKVDLKLEPVEVIDFLREVVGYHHHLASVKNTRVVIEKIENGALVVDPLRLRQVVDNLISNAVKYSPPGSVVKVRAYRHIENEWRFEVQDEGPGITEEDRSRLFQDFARLSARPTGGEKSTGLGLAITRRLVEAQGGAVGVDSSPGVGATFWFTLLGS